MHSRTHTHRRTHIHTYMLVQDHNRAYVVCGCFRLFPVLAASTLHHFSLKRTDFIEDVLYLNGSLVTTLFASSCGQIHITTWRSRFTPWCLVFVILSRALMLLVLLNVWVSGWMGRSN